jgi:hypothetical protein
LAIKDIPAIEGDDEQRTEASIMDIDKQRIKAVRTLQALGYCYRGGKWVSPAALGAAPLPMTAEADALHGALMRCPDALTGCLEGSDEEAELRATLDAIEAYEVKRWPLGMEPGGKG